jgi:hypothetical protein
MGPAGCILKAAKAKDIAPSNRIGEGKPKARIAKGKPNDP